MNKLDFESSVGSDLSEDDEIIKKVKLTNGLKQKQYRDKRKLELQDIYGIINKSKQLKKNNSQDNHELSSSSPKKLLNLDPKSDELLQTGQENLINDDYTESEPGIFLIIGSLNNSKFKKDSFCSQNTSFSFDDEDREFSNDNKPIYLNSNITRCEFVCLFEALVDKLSIPETKRNVLYNFVQLLLPKDNNIPKSYNFA